MPLPMLEPAQSETGGGGGSSSFGALPFALPELGLGSSMRKRTGKRKAVVSMEDDDEDPREEAQVRLFSMVRGRNQAQVVVNGSASANKSSMVSVYVEIGTVVSSQDMLCSLKIKPSP